MEKGKRRGTDTTPPVQKQGWRLARGAECTEGWCELASTSTRCAERPEGLLSVWECIWKVRGFTGCVGRAKCLQAAFSVLTQSLEILRRCCVILGCYSGI